MAELRKAQHAALALARELETASKAAVEAAGGLGMERLAADDERLAPGRHVRTHGLAKRPDLNDQVGIIVATSTPIIAIDCVRVAVQFPHLTNAVKIKLENLTPVGIRTSPPGTAATTKTTRRAEPPTPRKLDFEATASLLKAAGAASTAQRLREDGYAVLPLNTVQAALVRSAGDAAARRFDDDAPQPATLAMTSASGGKRILAVRPSPLHTLRELLFPSAMSALHGLAADMQLPLDHFTRLVGDPMTEASDEEDCVLLSAMQYSAAEGCEEHVDRGLLTLVAGQTAATLEVYDRRQRKWVRPPATDESVVIFAGGTLHRASAGLVPAATGDADDGIGATLHRVAAGGDARRSLVLRLRARPSACFDCGALAGRAGAVARFVDGRESVDEFLKSQNYRSVNAAAAEEEEAAASEQPAATPSRPTTKLDELLEDGLDTLVQDVYDDIAERCIDSGLLREDAVDAMTDELAAQTDFEPSLKLRAMLGQLQALYILERAGNLIGRDEPCTQLEKELLEQLTSAAAKRAGVDEWCTLLISELAKLELVQRREEEEEALEYQQRREEEQRRREEKQARQLAERLRIRRAATDVRIFLTLQLSRDAAELIQKHAAARDIQAHFHGHSYRKKAPHRKLNLKVVSQDGSELFFKMKKTTPMSKLMNAYCQRQGVNLNAVRFLFDGERLRASQTPEDLEMEDGDVIDVMMEQAGD